MWSKVKDFLGFLVYERGLAKNTRESYRTDLQSFVSFLEGKSVSNWASVTASTITEFFEYCARQSLSSATRARRMAAIKGLFAFLSEEGIIDRNPAAAVSQKRISRPLPHTLSEDQVEQMLAMPSPDAKDGLRDIAILELLYGCGLRVSELVDLQLDAIRLDEALVRVKGKGSKVRIVPIGSKAEGAIRRYIAEGRVKVHPISGEAHVFLSKRGNKLNRNSVYMIVRKYARAAGVGEPSPHWLRHSFASHLMAHGAPIRAIQELLGHADIATTQIYTHVDAGRLTGIVNQFHARSQK